MSEPGKKPSRFTVPLEDIVATIVWIIVLGGITAAVLRFIR
jgi:hypothetical protein